MTDLIVLAHAFIKQHRAKIKTFKSLADCLKIVDRQHPELSDGDRVILALNVQALWHSKQAVH